MFLGIYWRTKNLTSYVPGSQHFPFSPFCDSISGTAGIFIFGEYHPLPQVRSSYYYYYYYASLKYVIIIQASKRFVKAFRFNPPTPHLPHKLTVVKYGPMNAPMDGNINPTVGFNNYKFQKIIQSRLSKGWSPFALSLRVPDCVLIHPYMLHLTLNKNSCLIFHGSSYIRIINGHKILEMIFYTKEKKQPSWVISVQKIS